MILLLSAYSDWKSYRIPNELVLLGWSMTLSINIVHYGLFQGLVFWFQGAVFPIIALWGIFLIHGMGAGDIKLFSVIGSLHGISFLCRTFAASILIAAAMSIIQLVRQSIQKHRKDAVPLGHMEKKVCVTWAECKAVQGLLTIFLLNHAKKISQLMQLREPSFDRKDESEKTKPHVIHMAVAIAAGYFVVLLLEVLGCL